MVRRAGGLAAVSIGLLATAFLGLQSLGTDLFVDSGQRLGNEASWGVVLGDVDADGDLDAVVANIDTGAIVWLNDGTGHFTDSGQRLAVGPYVAMADLDRDGALDLVFGSFDQPVTVWWNDGRGRFARGEADLAPVGCLCLATGDLTGDGRPDLFVGNREADLVLFNMGNRVFTDSGQRLGFAATGGAAMGDMDGDGDLDVVAAGWDEPGHVWQNDGTGRLTSLCTLATTSLHVHGVVLADYEGDGDLDAFFALAGGICCRNVWLNFGRGTLTPATFSLGLPNDQGIAVADFNQDGRLDAAMAVGSADPAPSTVWLGREDGYADTGLRIGTTFAGGVAAGDLDGDGDLDLFFTFLAMAVPSYVDNPYPNEVWLNTTIQR